MAAVVDPLKTTRVYITDEDPLEYDDTQARHVAGWAEDDDVMVLNWSNGRHRPLFPMIVVSDPFVFETYKYEILHDATSATWHLPQNHQTEPLIQPPPGGAVRARRRRHGLALQWSGRVDGRP
jgi:hypothetical protein